jgi:hypothetical protein
LIAYAIARTVLFIDEFRVRDDASTQSVYSRPSGTYFLTTSFIILVYFIGNLVYTFREEKDVNRRSFYVAFGVIVVSCASAHVMLWCVVLCCDALRCVVSCFVAWRRCKSNF